ncbi:P-loop NTPase [bacterium]|nr:P-loop NTPase [bacterium]
MKLAVASGKGGTGKTLTATNLAVTLQLLGEQPVTYADCDVEAPNGHLFLPPGHVEETTVHTTVPQIDEARCDGCGECAKICAYGAIVVLRGKVKTFPELCNACGGCSLVCPRRAITEVPRGVGVVKTGNAGGINTIAGLLDIGEARAIPVIKAVKRNIDLFDFTVLDAPPGTSCPVIETIRGVDYLLLVAEPTPFGFNDLELAVELAREMRLPFGVVLNRDGIGDSAVERFCEREGIEITARIPDDRAIAEVYSRGGLIVEEFARYRDLFTDLAHLSIARAEEAHMAGGAA